MEKTDKEYIWEDDDLEESSISFENVTDKDKFRLAAKILLIAAVIFVIIAVIQCYLGNDNEAVNKVWSFSSVALNSIVSLIIGYYFGKH